jgi:hypothetical protein
MNELAIYRSSKTWAIQAGRLFATNPIYRCRFVPL